MGLRRGLGSAYRPGLLMWRGQLQSPPQPLHPQAPEEEGVCLDQPPSTAGPESRVRSEWLSGWLCEGLGCLDVGTAGC